MFVERNLIPVMHPCNKYGHNYTVKIVFEFFHHLQQDELDVIWHQSTVHTGQCYSNQYDGAYLYFEVE